MAGTLVASSLPDVEEDEFIEEEPLSTEVDNLDEAEAVEAERRANVEAEARRQGWRPQAEFRGNPADWVDAETFVQRGRDYLPFVRKELEKANKRNETLERELGTVRTQLQEQAEVLNEVRQMARTANEAAYNRAINDMKRAQRQAATEGDMVRFDELQEQIDEAAGARASAPPKTDPAPQNPRPTPQVDIPPEVQNFVDENPWMMRDRVLYQAMQAEHVRLLEEAPGLTTTENLERAKEAVMARFPQKFGREPAPKPQDPAPQRRVTRPTRPTVNPPTPSGSDRNAALRIDSIQDPVERDQVRRAFEKFARQMPGYTEEEHMKLYFDPKADVLAMRQERQRRK